MIERFNRISARTYTIQLNCALIQSDRELIKLVYPLIQFVLGLIESVRVLYKISY